MKRPGLIARALGGACLLLASLGVGACKMDPLIARCVDGDLAACELGCQRGLAGEGGCLSAGWLALEAGKPREHVHTLLRQGCSGGAARACLKEAALLEGEARETNKAPLGGVFAEQQRLLERACQLASQGSAPDLEPWPYQHSRAVLEQACGGLARTTQASDLSRTRRAFELACPASAGAACALKFDEQLAAAQALLPRCKPPAASISSKPSPVAFDGTPDADRILACKQLATLLDPLRSRALAQSLCVGHPPLVSGGIVVDTCDSSSFLSEAASEHALRQPELWLGSDPPEW